MGKEFHHLTYNDRLKIEALNQAGHSATEIAKIIGVHMTTIYRELKRGRYMHTLTTLEEEERYSPELAHEKYKKQLKLKGSEKKIIGDHELIDYIEYKILNDRYSPYATLQSIRDNELEFKTTICLSTLYNYIRSNFFENIELADMPYKRKKRRKKKKVQKRASAGVSIEKRPEEIKDRESFGHWEMDTVKGKQGVTKKTILVLTERKTRIEILELMKNGTKEEVVKALDRIERGMGEKLFREKFKSITVDNGSEFFDADGMERSKRNKKKRTNVYYCHPYSSWERASNENQNRLVRRHIPKSFDFQECSRVQVKKIEGWINDYPREMFGGKSSREVYWQEFQEDFWRAAM